MLTLNIRLSEFRLTAQGPAALPKAPPQLRLCTTTHRLRAFDSPRAQPPPAAAPSSPSAAQSPVDLVFPHSFTVAWTETLPDRLALRAAMLTVALRVAHKPRFSAALCAPAPPMRTAAHLSVPLRDLAVSTVTQSLRLVDARGAPSPLTLSFHAVVDCPSLIRLSLADLRLAAKASPVGERFPLSLTLTHTLSAAYTTVTVPTLHPHDPPASRVSSDSASSEDATAHAPPSPGSNNSNIPDSTTPCSWSTHRIPDMLLQSPNLHDLAHSTLVVALAAAPEPGATPCALGNMLLSASLPLYDVWAALMHPSIPYRHTVALSSSVSLTMSLCADTGLPPGQMVGGVTTDLSVTGAKSVTFGAELLLDRVPAEPGVPPAWARVVDSFGTPYFHHRSSAIAVWTMPHDDAVEPAVRADELRAEHRGFDRFKRGVFVHRASGAQCWRHPDALPLGQTAPALPVIDDVQQRRQQAELHATRRFAVKKAAAHTNSAGSATGDGEQEASPRTSFSLSTVDCADVHPASLARRHDDMDSVDGAGAGARPPVVEMQWKMLGRSGYAPRDGTEGHTLTAVLGGRKMIKFGGAAGPLRNRTNHVDVLDVDALEWREERVHGVRPVARTGHAAVALGAERDRLLVFGGSSAQGRLNDVNMYHVLNSTWSPVSVSGPVPAARARSGMTVTQDGGTALLFGGRSIYRYLGGKYFDPLFVNAFHAERGLWEQLRPRGSGPRPAPRSGCVVELINARHMLVHGGYDDGDRFFDDTFVFDLASCSWQKLGPAPGDQCPAARESHASTVVDGDVVICGGSGDELFLGDVQVFDAGRMRWGARPRTVGLGPGKIGGGDMATTHDGRAVFVGGEDGWALSRRSFVLEVSHRSVVPVDALIDAVRERGPDAGRCVVCMDKAVTTMFVWCGHSVCCTECAPLVRNVCPVCRKPFSRIARICGDGGVANEPDES